MVFKMNKSLKICIRIARRTVISLIIKKIRKKKRKNLRKTKKIRRKKKIRKKIKKSCIEWIKEAIESYMVKPKNLRTMRMKSKTISVKRVMNIIKKKTISKKTMELD
jgi:hypothetical protein